MSKGQKPRKAHIDEDRLSLDGRSLPLPSSSILRKHGPGEGIDGPNEYHITDEHRKMVSIMRSNAMSVEAIAGVMGVNKQTLRRHFEYELDNGFDSIRGQMGAALVAAGLSGSVSAMKFWLASRCPEWRAAKELVDEPDKAPEDVVHFFLPSNHRDEPEEVVGPTIDGDVA
jgi:hypothetical protein